MSTQIPLRIARSPLRRQCLFQRRTPSTPRSLAAPSTRAFSSTPQRPRRKENRLVDVRMQLAGAEATVLGQPAPNVQTSKQSDVQEMAEDIGLLQGTVVRAAFSKLPSPLSWEFYSYFWTLVKSKISSMYSRGHYKSLTGTTGIMKFVPVDWMMYTELKAEATKLYKRYYESLAAGDVKTLRTICLPPLASSLRAQIAARGPLKVSWNAHKFKRARIVSHRCAPLGAAQPNTAYRQCIVRIESEQTLTTKPLATRAESRRAGEPVWTPTGAASRDGAVAAKATAEKQTQRVVEYIVMQTRLINGEQEEWKIWGFAGETTPGKMEEDEAYWKTMLEVQSSAAA